MDLDLAFRLFMNSAVAYLDEVIFFYRKHDGNSSRNEELRLTENIQVIEKLVVQNKTAGHCSAKARGSQIGLPVLSLGEGPPQTWRAEWGA
jgi:hypothetical protein